MHEKSLLAEKCIDPAVLLEFDSGRIRDPFLEEQIAAHLSTCETCERFLLTSEMQPHPLLKVLRRQCVLGHEGLSADRFPSDYADKASLQTTHSVFDGKEDSSPLLAAGREETSQLSLRIDRYFVIRSLGAGGFGDVLLAKDPEMDRLVAIKIPKSRKSATAAEHENSLREARTAAALNHPSIVPVYDCRELLDGRFIIVMRFIEGQSLRSLMKNDLLDPQTSASYVASIAEALAYAHDRGVWHRDVKPENIMIDLEGNPLLTDFGLAIHETEQPLHRNEFAGTCTYMSPEQIQGFSHHLDGRSDIWSLGVVLYELLTGQRPFRGDTRDALRDEILHKTPRLPREINPKVTADLESICMKCLSKAPEDRYSSARILAAQLRKWPRQMVRKTLAISAISMLTLGVAFGFLPKQSGRPIESLLSKPLESSAEPPGLKIERLTPANVGIGDFDIFSTDTGQFTVKSTAVASGFSTHRSVPASFEAEVVGQFGEVIGYAGILFGLRKSLTEPATYQCHSVFLSKTFPQDGIWLRIHDCEIAAKFGRPPELHVRRVIATMQLEEFPGNDFQFSVRVENYKLQEVVWNGRVINSSNATFPEINLSENSGLGVMALGNIRFDNISLKGKAQ